jgi:hypothetical protein
MREVAEMPSLQYSLMMTRLNLFPKIALLLLFWQEKLVKKRRGIIYQDVIY